MRGIAASEENLGRIGLCSAVLVTLSFLFLLVSFFFLRADSFGFFSSYFTAFSIRARVNPAEWGERCDRIPCVGEDDEERGRGITRCGHFRFEN